MSGVALRQDVEAGENAFTVARAGGSYPLGPGLTSQSRAHASQRFVVGMSDCLHTVISDLFKSLGRYVVRCPEDTIF